jgi:hypothetical protein
METGDEFDERLPLSSRKMRGMLHPRERLESGVCSKSLAPIYVFAIAVHVFVSSTAIFLRIQYAF